MGVNAVFIETNNTRIPKLLCEYVQTGRRNLSRPQERSMKTDKSRNNLYPVAPGVPLILEYEERSRTRTRSILSLNVSQVVRCTPLYSLKFPICYLIANYCTIPFRTGGFYVYHQRLCLTLKANSFCTKSNLVIFVIIIIIITSSKPTLPLLSFFI